MTVTAIVLAGGRSRRFGADKLAAGLDGGPLLAAAIEAAALVADRVVVAGPALPEGAGTGDSPVALVLDREAFGGPLMALADVLATVPPVPGDLAIVVGGDMPRLVPAVLRAMLERLADPAIDAVLLAPPATPGEPPPRQVLPLAVRSEPAARAAAAAVGAGGRSLQALLDRLRNVELAPRDWLPLDPEAWTLTDVDTKSDLDRLRRPERP